MIVVTAAERPDLVAQRNPLVDALWPRFMQEDPIAGRLWPRLDADFAAFQHFLLAEDGALVGAGNAIPFRWSLRDEDLPEAGWDAVLEQGVADRDSGRVPTALSALSITLAPDRRGQGLAERLIAAMKAAAAAHGLAALVAPVRPTQKARYPLTPIGRYAAWQRPDGAPFDPWIRTHWRLGARAVKPALRSMTITGTIADWEGWTGMAFPDSGDYVVPGALAPVQIDREDDVGRYVEPNLWMRHPV
ncbi:GNAT family N-acetyltransferase [Inquilinus limosus]|uniref:GNAT family N-acetyltransferase n=1 Tax=Inquilinus limosus TaxID=171674 RepID=UPI003F162DC8